MDKKKNNKGKDKGKTKVNEKYPHFRYYTKSKHPALIVEEHSKDEYNYRKVTSSEKEGRHLNERIDPNPDKTRKTSMYIGKRVRHDNKKFFSLWKFPWKYPKK